MEQALPKIDTSGSRTLLALEVVQRIARQLREDNRLQRSLQPLVAVQCTLFRKTQGHNWSVRPHRDSVVAVSGEGPWPGAGVKEGMRCARPPRDFLDRCVAVRLSLDDASAGDLQVQAGSHLDEQTLDRNALMTVPVPRNGGLVFKASLGHASSKLQSTQPRRVLHFLFAPANIPDAYHWYHVV